MVATAIYSGAMVLCKETAFPLYKAMERRYYYYYYYAPAIGGHFGITRSVRLSVPWRGCLGYRHADCLQLSNRQPPEMCGLRTRPRTDADPLRFLPPSNCISSRGPRGDTLLKLN